ncbi:MAG: hypothetical protein ACR2JB_15460 [Bryobacteraceae bacterium]
MFQKSRQRCLIAAAFVLSGQIAFPQEKAAIARSLPMHLRVEGGTPLRLYITHRAWYRRNEIIEARFAEPVWAFDRIVIPAGTVVHGQVTKLDPVARMVRARAIVGGDFTPLKRAEVSFTSLSLADGRTLLLDTQSSQGLSTIYTPPSAKKSKKKQNTKPGHPSRVRQFLRQQAQSQMSSRSRGFFDLIRGPNKREWVENFLLEKLPYHPQWYRAGTRFDAVLNQPLNFGDIAIQSENLQVLGTHPPPDSVVQMRVLSNLSSSDARVGESMSGVLSEPLFSAEHKLVLPQGTRLEGKITLARPARLFHRGGQLRFAIEKLELPTLTAEQSAPAAAAFSARLEPAQAQLAAVEADPGAVKVDREGTAKATESKTRLLRPVIAALVATKSLDNDTGKQTASGTVGANTSGRALGGFSGFGLLGIAAARGPREIGAGLGFYGLAWSVYSNVVARGREVTFEKNTAMAIRFGAPPRKR